ncbi:MAG: uracil-DNA glycosylase family protein [Myxococcales bacterium]|nr:uracil-DNA glycosylase family protein [Myxococcales bacterium]
MDGCRLCPGVLGPVVHGEAVTSRVLLVGQAPGPREGTFGRPFAWTAGKTMFRWFERALGAGEEEFRSRVYIAAVARCFPGKAKGGGDRRPDAGEVANCRRYLEREVAILEPELVIPVGTLAIEQVLGEKAPLVEVVGRQRRVRYHGREMEVVCLPHPSGASTWPRTRPGASLLERSLRLISRHPAVARLFRRSKAVSPSGGALRAAPLRPSRAHPLPRGAGEG